MRSSHHQTNGSPSQLPGSAMLAMALPGWTAICFGPNPLGSRGVLSSGTGVKRADLRVDCWCSVQEAQTPGW